MDSKDKILLRLLQQDGRATNAELADRASLSESACSRRVKTLEADGVITGYAAQVSARAVGLSLTAFVSITLSSQAEADLQAFEAAIGRVDEVTECHLMTGVADYLVRVVAESVDDLERLHNVLTRLPAVARINSSIGLRAVVSRSALPIR